MEHKFRCDCPITSALDILGDKWILVIIKQLLVDGKETFKDFMESDEAIASNILTTKLKFLEEMGFVTHYKLPSNKKSVYYQLTEKGLSLTPIIVELAIWSDENLRELNTVMRNGEELTMMRTNKEAFAKALIEGYREKIAKTSAMRNAGQ